MKNSPIQWTDHTWSPWLGCRKVSLGCDNCYIVRTTPYRTRHLVHGGRREELSIAYWKQPLGWNKTALASGTRIRVFPSLCDWLDDEVDITWLANFLDLIRRTPNLDWQLLTKRPQNFESRIKAARNYLTLRDAEGALWLNDWLPKTASAGMPARDGKPPDNVWLGVSVETQKYADERIPLLLATPAKIRFLSCEPLLGPVDIWWALPDARDTSAISNPRLRNLVEGMLARDNAKPMVNWVICGGESDDSKIAKARPMHPNWARGLRDQCAAAGVPFFFKQWGELRPATDVDMTAADNGGPGVYLPFPSDGPWMARVGKHAAGRLLDGVEHNAMPALSK